MRSDNDLQANLLDSARKRKELTKRIRELQERHPNSKDRLSDIQATLAGGG